MGVYKARVLLTLDQKGMEARVIKMELFVRAHTFTAVEGKIDEYVDSSDRYSGYEITQITKEVETVVLA